MLKFLMDLFKAFKCPTCFEISNGKWKESRLSNAPPALKSGMGSERLRSVLQDWNWIHGENSDFNAQRFFWGKSVWWIWGPLAPPKIWTTRSNLSGNWRTKGQRRGCQFLKKWIRIQLKRQWKVDVWCDEVTNWDSYQNNIGIIPRTELGCVYGKQRRQKN